MVAVYRGWHELESRRGGPPIIDFDLAPTAIPPIAFESRIGVLDALEDLAGGLPGAHAFLVDRVKASLTTVRALIGQQIPFHGFILDTLRIEAAPIPNHEVGRARSGVRRILERNGLDLDRKSRSAAARRFTINLAREELRAWLSKAAETDAGRAMQLLAPDSDLKFTCEFSESPAYWIGWATARAGECTRVRYNLTPRNPYLRGDAFMLAHHEVAGHALQMECWRQRIAAGELHPAYGLTVVHSFEQFLYEGVAQTLTDLVFSDDELDDDRLWARDYARYRSYIYHRAHLDLNMGVDIRAVFQYLDSSLPFEDWAGMETELRSRCLDPILRAYQFVYAASDYAFLSALRTHGKKAFLSFIRDLYAGPRTMGDILRALQQGALPPQTARW